MSCPVSSAVLIPDSRSYPPQVIRGLGAQILLAKNSCYKCTSDELSDEREEGRQRTEGSSGPLLNIAVDATTWMYARSGCLAFSCSITYEN